MAHVRAFKVSTPYPKHGETGRRLGMSKSQVNAVKTLVAKTKPKSKAGKRGGGRAVAHRTSRRAAR